MGWIRYPAISTHLPLHNSSLFFLITSSAFTSSNSPFSSFSSISCHSPFSLKAFTFNSKIQTLPNKLHSKRQLICNAAEFKFPDPIPEFAESETQKFKTHLQNKLSKKDIFGDSLEDIVAICTEIFDTFLHTEYGGPGTLLVLPFIDMADTLNERGLPGGPQAARAAVKWAQQNVDRDWKEWTSGSSK